MASRSIIKPKRPSGTNVSKNKLISAGILESFLNCTKCSKLATSPVYSCSGGHIFCGVCLVAGTDICNLNICGKALSPCGLAESILKSADATLACRNVEAGCEVEPKAWDMKAHLEVCGYRPIQCFEKRGTDCGGKVCNLDQFLDHLLYEHQIGTMFLENESATCNVLPTISFFSDDEINGADFHRGETEHFKYDYKTFLFHRVREAGVFFNWITIIGDEEDAKKFRFRLKFSGKDKPLAPKIMWELPVHSVRFVDFEKVKEAGGFASYHSKALMGYAETGVLNEGSYEYIWCSLIEMVKLGRRNVQWFDEV